MMGCLPEDGEDVFRWQFTGVFRKRRIHALYDVLAVGELGTDPITMKRRRGFVARAAAAEGIHHQLVRVRGDLEATGSDHRLQLIDMPPCLELRMTRGRGVLPEIRQVQTFGIEVLAMAAIILDVAAAMPADGIGRRTRLNVFGKPFVKYSRA